MIKAGDIRRMHDGSVYFVFIDHQGRFMGMWFNLNTTDDPPSEDDEYLGNLSGAFSTFRDKLDEHR